MDAKIGPMTNSDWRRILYSSKTKPGFTVAETVLGIIQYYAYHAGQIILLVRVLC